MANMCLTWRTFFRGHNRQIVILLVLLCILQHTFAFSDSFNFEVKENSPPQTYVGKIVTRSGFTYRFNDEPAEFSLDPESGVITTGDALVDREAKDQYNLVILSSSPTYPIEVRIRITDVNDNVPYWPSSINTNISFSESAPVGTKVIIDNAIDLDTGELKYSIQHVSDLSPGAYSALPFKLNHNSSSSFLYLEVADKLDRELQSNYLLNITATDQDGQYSFALFNIRILDTNDQNPQFDHSDYSVSINESTPKGVSILQVRATDADEEDNENSRISYYLNSDDFQIDQNTGIISTSHDGQIVCGTTTEKSADECWRICVFTVFAHDYGVPRQTGRTYVTVKIYDSQNHAPKIKFRHFSKSEIANVDETAANGSIVAAVSVVDFDQGLNGLTTVQITGGNELAHFRLDTIGNSHIIRLASLLDRKKVPEYNLTVTAYDHGNPRKSSEASLRILVQDSNRHIPVFEKKLYETAISETQNQVGIFVYALQATDEDEGINSQIYYSLSGANSHYFKIDSASGLITTDKVINREEIDFFELKITARDSGNSPRIAYTTLQVKILDINDEVPTVELLSKHRFDNVSRQYEVDLQEGQYLDLDLALKDGDLAENGTVDIQLLYDHHNLFRIDSESMKLLSTGQLHYNQCPSYKIVLLATDRAAQGHQLSSLTTIMVNVKDKHEAKSFFYPRQYFASIAVDSFNLSAVIIKLAVNDASITSATAFAIRSEDDLINQLFNVNEYGEVRFASTDVSLQNAPSRLSFEVACLDCSPTQNTAQVTVFLVETETPSAPELKTQYHFQVEENTPAGTIVGQLEFGFDQYEVHLVGGDVDGHFRISGNSIHTSKPLDREEIASYRLRAIVVRSGYLYHIDGIEISVSDVNDCQPQFVTPFDQVVLHRLLPPMFVVRRLDAYDADLQPKNSTKYRLVDNPHDLFLIDGNELKLARTIGEVTRRSKKPISAILRVKIQATDKEAQDSGEPGALSCSARCRTHLGNELTLFISINSSQTSRARFMKRFYEFFISESTPINEQVFKLATLKFEINDDSINFAIVSGNANNSFGILPSGFLYTRHRLDRESIDLYLLTVVLLGTRSTGNGTALQSVTLDTCQVLVHLQDANDNRPLFDQATYLFTVPENVPKGFLLGQVRATDRDVGDNCRLVYSLVKSYYSSFVQIDPDSGYLWTSHEYDHESLDHFEISVQASDQPIDEPQYSSQVTVRIQILDRNDNMPVFDNIPANVSLISLPTDELLSGKLMVSETTEVGLVLANFRASDIDSESSITYRLNDLENCSTFLLNHSGALTLAKALDREEKDSYKVAIEASDGQHISRFELLILVEDEDDCQPEWVNFTQTELFVPENISIGSEIMQFHAVDRDLGSNALFFFAIEDHSDKQKVFEILKQKLVVVNNLDYEKSKVHLLNVSLIEKHSGKVASSKSIRINVLDVNDCEPVFVQRTDTEVVRVLENIDMGTILLSLQAHDCDQNDVLSYEMVSCNTHYHTHKNIYQKEHELQHKHDSNNCPLKLNTRNGEIINMNKLDREVIESINLQLSVRDSAGHVDRMKVIFILDDINDESPLFVSPKKIVVSKEAISRQNAIIGSVKAIDLDMGINSVITYKLQTSFYEQFLELDRFLGTFKVKKSLEYLEHPLVMNISAMDGGGLSTTDTVQFIVRPDLPSLERQRLQIDIYENEPIGTQVTRLKCHEPDLQHSCQFHLVNATDRNFQVDTWTGIISTVDLIDREMLEARLLEVLVISKANLQTVEVQVQILDENDNPPYLTNTSIVVHLKESVQEGTEVFDLSRLIADEDTNNKFDYQMINCTNCDGTFSLNRKTGILTLQSPLDSEKNNKYRILFGVSDGIYLLTSLMDVIVDDENDNQPYFNQSAYVFAIEENTDRGVVVGKVVAFDDDVSNKNLYYSILPETTDLDILLGAFSLDSRTGQFTLSKRLDYEIDPNHYVFLVQASDGKFTSLPVKVVFELINLPDNAPIFETSTYKVDVIENSVLQDVICVSATDADLKSAQLQANSIEPIFSEKNQFALKYSIEGSRMTKDSFYMNATSGCISVVKPLDREYLSRIDLNVVAYDGYFNATALVEVKVLDDNDHFPIFDKMTPSVLRVEENSPIDTVVYTFKATDLDEPPNSYIKYEIVLSEIAPTTKPLPFVIGPIDGQLKVTGNIDRELVDHFDLIIRANDYGLKYSEFACRIEIDDIFDNSPTFDKLYYEVSLYENISVGEIAFKLNAQDADPTDEISYKIISGNSLGHFRIDDDSLLVSSKLNYEVVSVYDLKIDAIDKGGNIDTANLKVSLVNVMDERPVFVDSPYMINWFENQIGVLDRYVARPEYWTTLEEPSHLYINYLLVNNYENSFRLNSSTGVLSVIKPIDHEMLIRSNSDAEIELKLIAIDTRSRLSSEGIVLVYLRDENDNAPYFGSDSYTFHLNENQMYESNHTIGYVSAFDLDQADRLSFHLEGVAKHSFAVDFDGRIYVNSSLILDREQQETYHLRAVVSDSKHTAVASVIIRIQDLNDCLPKLIKVNNVRLNDSNKLHLNISTSQLKSLSDKKFPLLGFQVEDCDQGVNSQVQFRLNNEALYNLLALDPIQGLIKWDHKGTYLKDSMAKLSPIEVTLSDMPLVSQLSSVYWIYLEPSSSNSIREGTLLKQNVPELSVSEWHPVNQSLYNFELLHPLSELSIYAGDVYGHFSIRNHNLVLSRPLDFESKRSFELYLLVGSYQKEYYQFQYVFVRVNVLNENDNAPTFLNEQYNASIPEEEDALFVTKVTATDLDSSSTRINYALVDQDKVPFRIDPASGDIWTESKIDREVNSSFRLTVIAQDEGGLSSTCTVLVTIEDRNDNPPRFTRLFRVNITENLPIGSFVIQMTSIDKDQKAHANVTYELLPKSEAFEIDPVSGNVYVAGPLDREQKEEYLLTVSADDGSWKAQTTLTIFLVDLNDISPSFEKESYQFELCLNRSQNMPANVTIGRVRAVDLDQGANGLVRYRLKSRSKYFLIDPHSGEIVLKRIPKLYLDPEMSFRNDHFLTVLASDQGVLPRTSEVSVLLRCADCGHQTSSSYFASEVSVLIPEDLANHSLLYTCNSLLSLSVCNDQAECIAQSRYNEILFTGQSKVKANRSYLLKARNFFREILLNVTVTEGNIFAPAFVGERNSTTFNENVYGHVLVDRFEAIDQDPSAYNNVVRYALNLTTLHWNVNASNYLVINYRDKYPHLFNKNLSLSEIVSNIGELSQLQSPFTIHPSSGELHLSHALDFELITRYSLVISASDNAWYAKVTSFPYDVLVGDVDDYYDYNPKSLRTNSMRPDPMSIGVILVVFFFIVLILAISTSFLFYHNQKKNHLRDLPIPQRKLFLDSLSPYVSSNPQLAGQALRSSRLPSRSQGQVIAQASGQLVSNQMVRPQPPAFINSASVCAPLPPSVQTGSHSMHIPPNMMPIGALCKSAYRPELGSLADRGQHSSVGEANTKRPDLVGPSGLNSSNSVINGSESASMVASRMQIATGASSIYTHTNSENYTDNYSNMLASAEHYDLENASSIAPSDIDIVYHYKGFRNRDNLSTHQKHAPLSRLSPSVSELSSAPRILTLQDLSPQVPPCPPVMSRAHMRKPVNPMTLSAIIGPDDDVAVTENSFNCSEFGENYDLCKKDKNVFQHVW